MRRPLDFSLLRFAAVFALALAGFALQPASVLWRDSYCGHEKKYRPVMLAAGLVLCTAAFLAPFGDRFNAGVATGFYNTPDWSGTSRIDFTMHINDWASNASAQYGALAHSLLNGRLDLEKDPPAAVVELQNPTTPPPVRRLPPMHYGMWPTTMAGIMSTLGSYPAFCSNCPLRH